MNKRLLKRHKREFSRATNPGKLSEPDLRTPEQLMVAREASRAVEGRQSDRRPFCAVPIANHTRAASGGAADTEVAL
jgi:hypothetical protein